IIFFLLNTFCIRFRMAQLFNLYLKVRYVIVSINSADFQSIYNDMRKIYIMSFVMLFIITTVQGQASESEVSLKETMLKMKKRKMLLAYLDLSEAEKAAFWPLYEGYSNATKAVELESLQLLAVCAAPGSSITDKELERYSKRLLMNDILLAKLRREYYTKFKKALSPQNASQFMQFDDSFRMMLRMDAQ